MNWFDRLAQNKHIVAILLANDQGEILRASFALRSDTEVVASMLQAADVLAQTLSDELGGGPVKMMQISTRREHLLLFPLVESRYFTLVRISRTAPIKLVMVELERVLGQVTADDLAEFDEMIRSELDDIDAAELIEAVREWLSQRPQD